MTLYYVSPAGADAELGTVDRPFATLQHAHDLAHPGDTIYLRGGIYRISSGVRLTNDGAAGLPITVTNYPGEKPVLDASSMTQTGYFGGWALDLVNVSWNHIKGIEIKGGPEGGLVIRGASHSNTIEQMDVHDNGRLSKWEGKGISLFGASSNNLLLNNDSHDNRDLTLGNADGFNVSTTGAGNVLRGNRAWGNSDDGFDFFKAESTPDAAPVQIVGNWAFDNGFDRFHGPGGNGSGFKLGGARRGESGASGGHTVTGNVAWGNRYAGFDENDATKPSALYNNTAYDNAGYNFGFWQQNNVFYNNLAFGAGRVAASGSGERNSWMLSVPPRISDFVSLDDRTARGPRASDGSLPKTDFLHLSQASGLVDRGIDVGAPYSGAAPDLGSFERFEAIDTEPSASDGNGNGDVTVRQKSRPEMRVETGTSRPYILTGVRSAGLVAIAVLGLTFCISELRSSRRTSSAQQTARVGSRGFILKPCAWSCVVLIAYLSLIPDDLEVRTSMPPGLEHAVAYAGTITLLILAYPTWKVWLLTISLAAYSGLLEFLQMFSHGRHPGLDGVAWSSAGALGAAQFIQLYRNWRKSRI